MNVVEQTPERMEKLMEAFGLHFDSLLESEAQQLSDLISEYNSIFAFDGIVHYVSPACH